LEPSAKSPDLQNDVLGKREIRVSHLDFDRTGLTRSLYARIFFSFN
jgi:hypothetical protein